MGLRVQVTVWIWARMQTESLSLDCLEIRLDSRRPGAAVLVRMLAFIVKLVNSSEAVCRRFWGVKLARGCEKSINVQVELSRKFFALRCH